MKFFTALALFAGLGALTAAIPAVEPTPEVALVFETGSITRTAEPENLLSRRAECHGSSSFSTADALTLGNTLQQRGNTNALPRLSYFSWTYNTARVCVFNEYFFEDTVVTDWETGWGVLATRNQCCTGGLCTGGHQIGHGTTGLNVKIILQASSRVCST